MAFNDLLSSSFLFSIAIIIILIGGIFAYVSYRMSEQDHKITSMLGLISTMADELQFFRSRTERVEREREREERTDNIMISPVLDPNNLVPIVSNYPTLISVSDDESESESDSESESGSEDDDQSEESESDEEEQDEDDQDEDELTKEVLNLEGEHETLDLEELEDLNRDETIKSIHLETPIDLNISKEEEQAVDELFVGDLKTISIMDLEESNKKPDYKKMSLNKLREVVVEKGLIVDASKMKKPELLKLLGDE
jgi:hypothetical protein